MRLTAHSREKIKPVSESFASGSRAAENYIFFLFIRLHGAAGPYFTLPSGILRPGLGRADVVELGLGEWTPRNTLRQVTAVVTDMTASCLDAVRRLLIPRLVRVLAPFPEARAAVVELFLEMEREGVGVPCSG
jgi:hypothetical protein